MSGPGFESQPGEKLWTKFCSRTSVSLFSFIVFNQSCKSDLRSFSFYPTHLTSNSARADHIATSTLHGFAYTLHAYAGRPAHLKFNNGLGLYLPPTWFRLPPPTSPSPALPIAETLRVSCGSVSPSKDALSLIHISEPTRPY